MAANCRPDGPDRIAVLPDYKFGVELEIINLSIPQAHRLLTENGITAQTGAYNSRAPEGVWNVTSDSTVPGGCEVKTPHLSGMNGLNSLLEVTNLLNQHASVNRSCGLHVHVDASDLTGLHLRRILMIWAKHQKVLNWWAAPDRRDGGHSCNVGEHWWERVSKRASTARSAAEQLNRTVSLPRTCAINLHALFNHGTIEFRLHEGTLDAEVVHAWVVFLLRLVKSCTEIRFGFGDGILERNVDSLRSLFQKIGIYPAWCYYRRLDDEMSKAATIIRKKYMKFCREAGVDPDPAEGKPGWSPRRMGG